MQGPLFTEVTLSEQENLGGGCKSIKVEQINKTKVKQIAILNGGSAINVSKVSQSNSANIRSYFKLF